MVQVTKRLRTLPLPTYLINTPLQAYLPQFLSPGTSCLAFDKKLQGILEGKQLEDTEQASEPDPDMAGILKLSPRKLE